MGVKFIYLIRHGQFDYDDDSPDGGGLTETGRVQARRASLALKGSKNPIHGVISSTMRRALETAEIIAEEFQGVFVEPTDTLREFVPHIAPHLEQQWNRHWPEAFEIYTPERIASDRKIADRAFEEYFRPLPREREEDQYVVLAAHGNLIRYLICRVLELPAEDWNKFGIYHCGISQVAVMPDGFLMLVTFNAIDHLPPNLRTS
jgi:serine/threonine-protein phosphatase PGAM5